MALKFFNIRTGESRIVKTDPVIADAHIAALWGSSDRGPNVNQGQDFGWRLAPETVVEVERLMADPRMVERIAVQLGVLPDSVNETNILTYISTQNDKKVQGLEQTKEDFEKQYEEDIRRLRATGQMDSSETINLPPKEEAKPTQLPSDTATEDLAAADDSGDEPENNRVTDEPITDQVKEATDEARDQEDTSDADDGGSEEEKADEAASVEESQEAPAEGESEQPATDEQPEQGSDTPSESPQVQAVDDTMSRAQLETIAKEAGVEAPSSFPNKPALVEAIRQKQSAQ